MQTEWMDVSCCAKCEVDWQDNFRRHVGDELTRLVKAMQPEPGSRLATKADCRNTLAALLNTYLIETRFDCGHCKVCKHGLAVTAEQSEDESVTLSAVNCFYMVRSGFCYQR